MEVSQQITAEMSLDLSKLLFIRFRRDGTGDEIPSLRVVGENNHPLVK